MKKIIVLITLCAVQIQAQPYLREDGKTRHRFAQSVFGIDLQNISGGNTSIVTSTGELDRLSLRSSFSPRFYISGVHFWGHAEFYFSFQPVDSRSRVKGITSSISRADIFGIKIYPWPIRKKSFRPFAGVSLSALSFQQSTGDLRGGKTNRVIFPLTAGINYCTGSYLLEASFSYNPSRQINYFISEQRRTSVNLPQVFMSIGLRKWFETTLASEKSYRNGETEKRYNQFKSEKKLSSWFIGAGPSSAFYLKESQFNTELFPFVEKPFSVIFPEISAGYFFEPFKIHTVLAFRHHQKKTHSYSVEQKYVRTSLSAEAFIYLFDYHGFNPYIGVAGSAERLSFLHQQDSEEDVNQTTKLLAPGVIVGWDILPDKLQGFKLRTNLRYFPLKMKDEKTGKSVDFSQIEFNFIQLIVYPHRIKLFRNSSR
jgi:hypothetical protein